MERLTRITAWLERARWLPLLLVRLTLFAVFAVSGWGKIHDLDKVTNFFTELHIPAPHANAVFVSLTELGCGSLLLVGLASRLAAAPLIGSMLVAIITAKRESVSGVLDLLALDEYIYIVLAIVIIVLGPGLVSIDGAIAKMIERRKRGAP
jgi:putative oxidoreductase